MGRDGWGGDIKCIRGLCMHSTLCRADEMPGMWRLPRVEMGGDGRQIGGFVEGARDGLVPRG